MKLILTPRLHYQGVCHKCQFGYYYPGGDCKAKPIDATPLRCAVCGFDGSDGSESAKGLKRAQDYFERCRREHRDDMIRFAVAAGIVNADSYSTPHLERLAEQEQW